MPSEVPLHAPNGAHSSAAAATRLIPEGKTSSQGLAIAGLDKPGLIAEVQAEIADIVSGHAITFIHHTKLFRNDTTRLVRPESYLAALEEDMRRCLRERPGECPIHTPLRVMPSGLIVAGNNRHIVAPRLPWYEMPCIVLSADLDEMGIFIEQWRDNKLHQAYSEVEEAHAIIRVMNARKCSQGAAGRLLGIEPSDVTKRVRLLKLPGDLLAKIGDREGEIVFTTAYHLSRLWPDHEQQGRELAMKAMKGLLTREDAIDDVASILGGKKPRKQKPLKFAEGGLTLTVPGDWALDRVEEAEKDLMKKVRRLLKSD